MNFTKMARPVGLASTFLIACALDQPEDHVAQSKHAIVSGQASANEAVGIVAVGGSVWASGVLVAPNIVITSATMMSGTRKVAGFYTGAGTGKAATGTDTKPDVESLPGLTKHAVKASGGHPMAVVPEPVPPNTANYPYKYDIGYVVLEQPLSIAPLPYGNAATPGTSCTTVGYGADGTVQRTGTTGMRRQGTVSITSIYDATLGLINIAGSAGLNNQGDSGGPLLCGGNVVGLASLFHFQNANNVIDQGMFQSTATVKAWIDSVIAANPPPAPSAPDAGAEGGTVSSSSSGGLSSSGGASSGANGASSSSSGSSGEELQVADDNGGGCSTSRASGSGLMLGLFALLSVRRKK